MSEWSGNLLGITAAFVYTCLIGIKALDLSKLKKNSIDNSGTSDNQIRRKQQALHFDLIRLFLDGTLLTGFLTTGLRPAWFGLFHKTALGCCTGCFVLISFTLLISVFVDWFPYRKNLYHSAKEQPSFSRFLLQQLVNICRIESALALVWCVFLILEPTEAGLIIRIGASALVLLLLRGVLQLARKHREQKAEEPN